ncbi:MAG: CoA-binding protein [Desulfobacteraceae bacterium]|nr:CoA-binding protein [Desulfobacteraceae bacterium]
MILADRNTRIIVQGITGREATSFTRDMLDYHSKVVAGVTPGKGGWEVHGVPVYDCVKHAMAEHPAEASVLSVPPAMVKEGVFEAIENGIRLVVILTERVPQRDVIEIIGFARERDAQVIGPNSLGLICPLEVKIGMCGGPAEDVKKAYSPGSVGVISRSGGMTTEIANLLTNHGLGQTTCISVGGDPIVGSNFIDLIPMFEKDPDTKAVAIFCEPGGTVEERLADYYEQQSISLPIIAFVAGKFVDEMQGFRFGHAGVIVEGGRGSTKGKIEKFKKSGIKVAESFSDIVELTREAIES